MQLAVWRRAAPPRFVVALSDPAIAPAGLPRFEGIVASAGAARTVREQLSLQTRLAPTDGLTRTRTRTLTLNLTRTLTLPPPLTLTLTLSNLGLRGRAEQAGAAQQARQRVAPPVRELHVRALHEVLARDRVGQRSGRGYR